MVGERRVVYGGDVRAEVSGKRLVGPDDDRSRRRRRQPA